MSDLIARGLASKNAAQLVDMALNVKHPPAPFVAAKGDGVTDDTAAIQSMANNLSAGGTLAFTQGTFLITSAIIITVPNVRIINLNGTILLGANATFCIDVSADNVTIDSLRFINPNGYTYSGTTRSGGIIVHGNNCIIKGNHIDGMLQSIQVDANGEWKGTQIINNRLTNCLGAINGTSQDKETYGDGISVFGSSCTIVGNFVSCKPNQDARIGINVEALPSYRTDGQQNSSNPDDGLVTVSGNVVEGNQGFRRAIHVERVKNFAVSGNTVRGCTWWGLVLAADYGSVTGNSVQAPLGQTTVPGSEWNPIISGIYSQQSSYITISGNTIYGRSPLANANLAHGIYLHTQSTQMNVNGNTIGGDAASLNKGIYLDTNNDDIVQNNKIQGSAVSSNGIYGWSLTRCSVNGNHVQGCGADGILIDSAVKYCEVNHNISTNNHGTGINLTNADSTTVIGNVCTDSQTTKTQTNGIYAWNPLNSMFTGNIVRGNATSQLTLANTTTGSVNANNIVA